MTDATSQTPPWTPSALKALFQHQDYLRKKKKRLSSGNTLITIPLISPEDVLMVLVQTLGIAGVDPAGKEGDPSLLFSLEMHLAA